MMIEVLLTQLLWPLVTNRVHADTAPDVPVFPLIVYQQVGGDARWYSEGGVASHRNARLQIHVWAKSRGQANTIALQVEKALAESGLIAQPYGAFTALYDDNQKIYGTRQDFGIWHNDSQ